MGQVLVQRGWSNACMLFVFAIHESKAFLSQKTRQLLLHQGVAFSSSPQTFPGDQNASFVFECHGRVDKERKRLHFKWHGNIVSPAGGDGVPGHLATRNMLHGWYFGDEDPANIDVNFGSTISSKRHIHSSRWRGEYRTYCRGKKLSPTTHAKKCSSTAIPRAQHMKASLTSTGKQAHIALVEVASRLDGCSPADDAVLNRAAAGAKDAQGTRGPEGGGGSFGQRKTKACYDTVTVDSAGSVCSCLTGASRCFIHFTGFLFQGRRLRPSSRLSHFSPMVTPSMTIQLLIFAFSPIVHSCPITENLSCP